MTYRLAFTRTTDGYLKVIASAEGTPTLTALHLHPDVLAAGARVAGLSSQEVFDLKGTADRAWTNEGLDVCCETMELNPEQLKSLGFLKDRRRFAIDSTARH
jgi:hypothetical protein